MENRIELSRLMHALPQDVVEKVSLHDLHRIVRNYNTPSEAPCTEEYAAHHVMRTIVLRELAAEISEVNIANGWEPCIPADFPRPGKDDDKAPYKLLAKMALVGEEVGEATTAIRNRDWENYAEELSDILIRILDIAHGLNIILGPFINAKLAKNRTRGFRHGGKAA